MMAESSAPAPLPSAPAFMAPKHRVYVTTQIGFAATAFVFLVLWLWRDWLPSPGISVLIIGVAAAIMSIHEEMEGRHKALWMLIISFFAVLEMVAIRHSETEQAKQQAHALEEERKHFNDIGDGIRGAIAQSQQQFTATMTQTRSILDKTQSVSVLTEQNLKNITGAASFPYVVPQPTVYPGPIPLFAWDHGKYMLTGVTLTIRRSSDFSFVGNTVDVGVLHPGWGKPLSTAIQPDPESNDDVWLIEMYTQSGYFTEILHFRKGHDGKYWAFKFWVNTTQFGPRKEKPTPKPKLPVLGPNQSISYAVYDRSQWSDEPQKDR